MRVVFCPEYFNLVETPSYSTDMYTVGEVIRFVTAENRDKMAIQMDNYGYSTVAYWSELPLAICRAALKEVKARAVRYCNE